MITKPWILTNPITRRLYGRFLHFLDGQNIERKLQELALEETARFVLQHMRGVRSPAVSPALFAPGTGLGWRGCAGPGSDRLRRWPTRRRQSKAAVQSGWLKPNRARSPALNSFKPGAPTDTLAVRRERSPGPWGWSWCRWRSHRARGAGSARPANAANGNAR